MDGPTGIVIVVLALGALLQLQPVFWTGLGLAQPFGDGAMMAQPSWLHAATSGAATLAMSAPVPFNAALVTGCMVLAGALALRPDQSAVFWTALLALGLLWLVGQDAGMLASGMTTDPNTAPVLALLLWVGRVARERGVEP